MLHNGVTSLRPRPLALGVLELGGDALLASAGAGPATAAGVDHGKAEVQVEQHSRLTLG